MSIKIVLRLGVMTLASWLIMAQSPNGRNVNRVDFGSGSGKLGSYYQTNPSSWVEQGDNGSRFDFQEVNRDDWSVYLHDASRGVNIQLDLHTKKVIYSTSNTARQDLYQIINSSAKMNGRLVTHVTFNGGTFQQKGDKQWVETGNGKVRFHFQEVNRDEWSVYLEDRSRNVAIQLDLYTKKVMYSTIGGARSELYGISQAR